MLLPAKVEIATQLLQANIIQHENCQEESQDAISIEEPHYQPGKAAQEGSQKRRIHGNQMS